MLQHKILKFEMAEHEAVMNVWWTGVLLKKMSGWFFRDRPVSPAQLNILMLLTYAEKPLTQREVSDRLLVDQSNVTGLVERMAKAGLIRRGDVPGDRRCVLLETTELGRRLVTEIEPEYLDLIRSLVRKFSPGELRLLNDFMVRLQAEAVQMEPALEDGRK